MSAAIVRELTAEDIARLASLPEGGLGSQARPLQRLRHSHHMMAQLIASGEKHDTIALATGYDPAYISNIQKDPAFKELVAHYSTQVETVTIEVATRLRSLGLDSIDELQDRLVTNPQGLTARELMELAELAFDRSGHGPSTSVNHNHRVALVPAGVLSRLKDEVAKEARGAVAALDAPRNSEPALGEVLDLEPIPAPEGTEGCEGGGPPLPTTSGGDT